MTTHQSQGWEEEFDERFVMLELDKFFKVKRPRFKTNDPREIKGFIHHHLSQTRLQAIEEYRQELEGRINAVDFVDVFATHPNRCWHNENSPTLEQDREENLRHIQDFKDHLLSIIRESKEK